ncbi:hypothetical protein Tco_0835877 [Tanacetum coccineum]
MRVLLQRDHLNHNLHPLLLTQVSGGNQGDQAKEIKHLKAHIKKLKKQVKPVITHHRAWMNSVSLKQRLVGKKTLKANWMQKESISKQGRKYAKAEPSVYTNPLSSFPDLLLVSCSFNIVPLLSVSTKLASNAFLESTLSSVVGLICIFTSKSTSTFSLLGFSL